MFYTFYICEKVLLCMSEDKKNINVRLREKDYRLLRETINSYADFALVPPNVSDVIREAIRLLHKKEVLGLVKEVDKKEEL